MKKPEKRIGVIYARFSSHAQNEASIEQQVEMCTVYAQKHGIEILEVYSDYHRTGTSDRRPAFQRMMRHAERGGFNTVIAWKSNRMARNMLNALTYEARLEAFGVRVCYALEEYGDDAAGRFALRMMMNVNQYFSETLSEDVRRAMTDNARKGLANGVPPYGYRRGENGQFELDPETAPVVKYIFDELQRGQRIVDIQNALNREGIKTARGGPWKSSSFNRLLQNERYTGVYIYADVRINGGMPAIVSRAQFDDIQKRLDRGRGRRGGRAVMNGHYALTGKAYCACCGAPMIGKSGTGKSGKVYDYYICRNQERGKCQKKPIRRDVLERRVAVLARQIAMDDETVEWIADKAVEVRAKTDSNAARIRELQAQRRETDAALQNVMRAIEQGIITETTKARLQELEVDRTALDDRIALLKASRMTIRREEILYTLQVFRAGDINDETYRRHLIDAFVDRVIVNDEEIQMDLRYLPGGRSTTYSFPLEPCPSGVRMRSPEGHQIQPMRTLGDLIVCIREHVVTITAKIIRG